MKWIKQSLEKCIMILHIYFFYMKDMEETGRWIDKKKQLGDGLPEDKEEEKYISLRIRTIIAYYFMHYSVFSLVLF